MVGIWSAITAYRIIGPIIFDDTINGDRYGTQILDPFLTVNRYQCQSAYFKQDMGGSPGDVSEEPVSFSHSPTFLSLHLRYNSFSNPSVALPTSQFILQTFRWFTYVTAHSLTILSLLLRHRLFTYVTWRAAHEAGFSICPYSSLTMTLISELFKERVVSRILWPSRSRFVSLRYLFMGKCERIEYTRQFAHNLWVKRQQPIVWKIGRIAVDELARVGLYTNFLRRC